MSRILPLICFFAALFAAAYASPNDRRRERELRLMERCDSYSAALSAAEPETLEARLSRFQDENADSRPEWDYYWRSHAKKPETEAPICDGTFLHRLPPRFPAMCGSQSCARVLPYGCVFVGFGINDRGQTTNVRALRHFPEGNSRATRMLREKSVEAAQEWCFPTERAQELVDPDRMNASQFTYKLENDPLDWETPDTEKELGELIDFYTPLSRESCDNFVEDYQSLAGADRSPSAQTDPTVIDAQPLSRSAPSAPTQSPGSILAHSCVVVSFSVSPSGETQDVKAVFSAPSVVDLNAEESASVTAAQTWRYEPASQNGQAVKQSGLITVLHFENSPRP